MAIKDYPYRQRALLQANFLDRAGMCFEISRRYLKLLLTRQWEEGETIYDNYLTGDAEAMSDAHEKRMTWTRKNMYIKGLEIVGGARRTSGCCTFEGLRSRLDVINQVLSVPGAYLYLFGDAEEHGGSGHAIALYYDGPLFICFDCNYAEYVGHNCSFSEIRTWWSTFWGDHYKKKFHNGHRQLVRYNTAA